jgi:dTDP-4-dehydrorhamnose 3,5-epimerase
MNFIETEIQGLFILEPKIFADSRGYFMESYRKADFDAAIGATDFIQDNESRSSRGVLRGLHFQTGNTAQAKLVRVIEGRVLDVAVDIRPGSPTFGKYKMLELTAENKRQFFIPRGFAHGFLVLSDTALFAYKVDNAYSPATERTLNCFDPDLKIPWPLNREEMIFS